MYCTLDSQPRKPLGQTVLKRTHVQVPNRTGLFCEPPALNCLDCELSGQETLPDLEFDLGGQTIVLSPDAYIGLVTGLAEGCLGRLQAPAGCQVTRQFAVPFENVGSPEILHQSDSKLHYASAASAQVCEREWLQSRSINAGWAHLSTGSVDVGPAMKTDGRW